MFIEVKGCEDGAVSYDAGLCRHQAEMLDDEVYSYEEYTSSVADQAVYDILAQPEHLYFDVETQNGVIISARPVERKPCKACQMDI